MGACGTKAAKVGIAQPDVSHHPLPWEPTFPSVLGVISAIFLLGTLDLFMVLGPRVRGGFNQFLNFHPDPLKMIQFDLRIFFWVETTNYTQYH